MFSYPIKRQKILAPQMIAVWLFCLTALVASKLAIYGCICMGAKSMRSSFVMDFDMGSMSFYIQLLMKSVVTISMGFIALFVKTSKASIVTSFILIFLTQANIGDFSLAGNLVFPVILTAISFIFSLLSIVNAEKKDLL